MITQEGGGLRHVRSSAHRPRLPKLHQLRGRYLGAYQNRNRTRPHGYTDPKEIDRLRVLGAPVHQTRRDEIVAAFDAWRVSVDADRAASGYDAAEAAWTAEINRHDDLERQIARTPAEGSVGLQIKMDVALCGFVNDEGVVTEEELWDGVEYQISRGVDHQSNALPYSIMIDLRRMLGGAQVDGEPAQERPVAERGDDAGARLLAIAAEFHRVDDLQMDLCARYHRDCEDIPGYAETEAPWRSALEGIADCPAPSWAGLATKAGVLKSRTVYADRMAFEDIADSLVEDILRLAGRTWDERSNRVPRSLVDAAEKRFMGRAA